MPKPMTKPPSPPCRDSRRQKSSSIEDGAKHRPMRSVVPARCRRSERQTAMAGHPGWPQIRPDAASETPPRTTHLLTTASP